MSTRMTPALLRQRRTKRNRVCAQAQDAASEWQATFDSVTDIVALISPDFRLRRINQAGYQALGRKPEELIGRKCYEVVHGLNSPIAGCPCAETLRTGKAGVGEITQGGRYFRATAAPVWGRNRELAAFSHTITDITERKQAEQALQASEQKFRGCFEQTVEGLILTDEEGRVTGWNPGQELISGRKAADVLGKPIWDVILGMSPAAMKDPTNARLMREGWLGLLASGALPYDGQPHESRIERPDGSGVEVQKVYFAIKSERGFRGGVFLRDISERQRAEAALRANEEKYRNVVENANEAIVVLQDGKVKFANPRASELTGFTFDEFKNNSFVELIHPDDRQVGIEYYQRRLKGEQFESVYPLRLIVKDGRTLWVEARAALINWEGRPAVLDFLTDITKRKQAQAALRESEKVYRDLVDNALVGVYRTTVNGDFLYANDTTLRICGFESFEDMKSAGALVRYKNPEDRQAMVAQLQATGRVTDFEFELLRENGESRNTVLNAVLDGKIISGMILDITARKQAAAALRASEERLRTITGAAKDAIMMMDDSGRVTFWNPAAEAMFGYAANEVLGRRLHGFLAPERFRAAHAAAFARFLATGEGAAVGKTVELPAARKDGSEVPVELSLSALQIDGRWHAVGVMRDITERKQAQDALAHKNTELAALDEQKNQFLGMAAHDLRNPMAVILNYCEFILGGYVGTITPEQTKFIATMKRSSEFMLKLVNDLLDVARIEAGKVNLELEPTDLAALLTQNIALNRVL